MAAEIENESPELEEEEVTDLSSSDVCTKYQEASKIVNVALKGLIDLCVPGAKVIDLCNFGTTVIDTQAQRLYTKKVNGISIERGVAFPVCVSVNEIVCNHSPLSSEELLPLKAGDTVKIDLGCHIDGYISVAAHTIVVPESADGTPPKDISDDLGNVAVAAYNTMLVAAQALKAGAKNSDVTAAVERVTNAYGVSPISFVRMHQMKRFIIDGVKEVALKEYVPDAEPSQQDAINDRVPPCEFEQAEVYAIDVALSTGDGRARPGELRTTVYKRNVEVDYRLKMKSSRNLLSEVDRKYPTLPFTTRNFSDERTAKMGVTECVSHGLLIPYPSLHEKPGTNVAHFKCTVLLLPSGTARISGLELPDYFKTDKTPDEESAKVLAILKEEEEKRAKKKASKSKRKKKKHGAASTSS